MAATDTQIDCIVENVSFYSADSGFTVLDVLTGGRPLTVVGTLGEIIEGERLILYGEYTVHPNYGQQFKAEAAERILPSELSAIERYLGSGIIKGVGPATAHRIVAKFLEETFDVIEHEPERLAKLRGISEKKAQEISEEFVRIHSFREVINRLSALGLPMREVLSLHKAFGAEAPELIEDNPYMLCGFPTYCEFETADGIAMELGRSRADTGRLSAGLIYVLRHNLGNGHTCLPQDALLRTTSGYLEIEQDLLERRMHEAADMGLLVLKTVGEREMVFLPEMYEAETYVAGFLSMLAARKTGTLLKADREIEKFEKKNGIRYSELQKETIRSSLTNGVLVMTGGPGTGKTTALKAVIEILEKAGEKIVLCAPTGRAAKRLSQLTERDASTIHRLLEVDYREGEEKIRFIHNTSNKLKCTAVIVDEMSMVDLELFYSLCLALKDRVKLILVGDADQLPAVGPGNLLRDIIDSGRVLSIELTEVFRQASQSRIVTGSHEVIRGEVPDLTSKEGDLFFLRAGRTKAGSLISSLVAQRLPDAYGFDPRDDIQVISPGRKGYLGVLELNEILREELNPAEPGKKQANVMGRVFRVGDKIMQIRNNYDMEWQREDETGIGVYNGDIGIIEQIDPVVGEIFCVFDGRRCTYTYEQTSDLELAFAVTVHKSQGSEYPAVVLSLADVNYKLQYRNLLYTAMTRAKQLLVIVGDENVFRNMVANDRKMLRYSGLKQFLEDTAGA